MKAGKTAVGLLLLCAGAALVVPSLAQEDEAPQGGQDADAPTFADIAPILNDSCVTCHSGAAPPLGLSLDSLENLEAGSWNGRVARPGNPDGSELVRRIKGISEPRMPFNGPPFLDDAQIALIETWIAAGMPEGEPQAAPDPPAPALPAPGEPVLFAHVQPIFLQRCVECHSGNNPQGPPEGLRLTSLEEILAGGDRMVVVPGNPGGSELVRRIRGQSRPRMPFDGPPFLDDDQIRLIEDWIEQGARDDEGTAAPVPVGAEVRFEGTLTGYWSVDDTPVSVSSGARVDDNPQIGDRVEVRGAVGTDGAIVVERIRTR